MPNPPTLHQLKIQIIEHLVKPELLKTQPGQPSIFGREYKLLNALLKRYPDPAFWLDLHLGYLLNSFAFFKTERGAIELDQAWCMHEMEWAQRPVPAGPADCCDRENELDTSSNRRTMAGMMARRSSPIRWADAVPA